MWYVAEIAFAQPENDSKVMYLVETSEVLLEAESARAAYEKALEWAAKDLSETGLFDRDLLGVTALWSVYDDPGDGAEIGGTVSRKKNVWRRRSELVPPMTLLSAIVWEEAGDIPVGDLVTERRGPTLVRAIVRADSEAANDR